MLECRCYDILSEVSPVRLMLPWRRVVAILGRVSMSGGVLILLFVAYQLWGTGLSEARAQDRLRSGFVADLQRPASSTASPSTGAAPPPRRSVPGEAVAILSIPAIGLEKIVVEGVSVEALKRGPGHYPGTPLPGQSGNAAIAGHRTTYGAPFFRLDELRPGDRIEVTTRQGDATYEVTGSRIVKPSRIEVLAATADDRLTLTTCNPRFSAAQRLIVSARLLDAPAIVEAPRPAEPPLPPDTVPASVTAELSGEPSPWWPTVAWGGLASAVWALSALLARRWKRLVVYTLGTPLFLVVLFFFFENAALLLPPQV